MKGDDSLEDYQIVELYFQRSEEAIAATAAKFGGLCYSIAYSILNDRMDSEETVSDTYMDTWKAIPPHKPRSLSSFLGKITRRNALDRWEYHHAGKRGGGEVPLALEELAQCIPSETDPQKELEYGELSAFLNGFVKSLPEYERNVFILRYWKLESISRIAMQYGFTQSKVKSMLYRIRGKLRISLEREGLMV